MTWNSDPLSSVSVSASVTQLQTNWDAIEDVIGVEHYTLSDANSGEHKPGISGVLYKGTDSQIEASLTVPGTGAIVWNTTYGILQERRPFGGIIDLWESITCSAWSQVKVSRESSVQSIPTTADTKVTLTEETAHKLVKFILNIFPME